MSPSDRARDLGDAARRKLLQQATTTIGVLALVGASYPFLASLAPSECARAQGGPVAVDLAPLPAGALATAEWRGKPVWILRRTADMVSRLRSLDAGLTDPASKVASQQPTYAANAVRSIRPEIYVGVGLCTHLGCIPHFRPEPDSLQPGWPGGFYCPCHGSKFDLAGRVYKGSPAPTNLVVPRYGFETADLLVIGRDAEGGAK